MVTDMPKAIKRCSKPETVALLVVRDRAHSRVNIMPLGWKMWTSSQPRMIAFSVHEDHYSHDLLMHEQECVLAWPSREMTDGIQACGSVSGVNTDKLELTGWITAQAKRVAAPLIDAAVINLECRITETLVTGDHTLFIATVVEGHLSDDEQHVVFTLGNETNFSHIGQGKGYRFGTFT